MAVLNKNTEEPNVVHIYCDSEQDEGVIKLHTPYGQIDIDVEFIKSSSIIQLGIKHGGLDDVIRKKALTILLVKGFEEFTPEQQAAILEAYETQCEMDDCACKQTQAADELVKLGQEMQKPGDKEVDDVIEELRNKIANLKQSIRKREDG